MTNVLLIILLSISLIGNIILFMCFWKVFFLTKQNKEKLNEIFPELN